MSRTLSPIGGTCEEEAHHQGPRGHDHSCRDALSLSACAKGGSTGSSNDNSGGSEDRSACGPTTPATRHELAAITQIVDDYNASQKNYKVEIQAFPQDSYNQSVVSAAAAKKLPCLLDIDGPNVPNWAWAGYLAPIEGMDDTFSKFLPTVLGKWNDKTYSFGYYDVALTMVTRKSILEKYGIRIPTADKPWTKDEFTAALDKIKASGDYSTRWTSRPASPASGGRTRTRRSCRASAAT